MLRISKAWLKRSPSDAGAAAGDPATDEAADESNTDAATEETEVLPEVKNFDEWLAAQPADVQAKFREHTTNLLSALHKERKAARTIPTLQKELDTFRTAQKTAEREKMSEADRVKAELADAKTESANAKALTDKTLLETAVFKGAVTLGFADPDDAFPLLPAGSVKLVDGKAVGVPEALKALAGAKPHLIKKADQGDNLGNHFKDNKDLTKPKAPSTTKATRL